MKKLIFVQFSIAFDLKMSVSSINEMCISLNALCVDENDIKIWAIAQPAQSGKTGVMIHRIMEAFDRLSNNIAIIMCDNSLLQTFQTSERIKNKRLSCVILSSQSKEDPLNVCNDICEGKKIDSIVVCNNKTQRNHVKQIIRNLQNTCKHKKITLYIDEADKGNSNSLQIFVNDLIQEYNILSSVCFITATPRKLFTLWDKMYIVPEIKTPQSYIGIKDLHKQPFSYKLPETNQHYLARLFEEKSIQFPKNGEIWFVPAEARQQSHTSMISFFFEQGIFDQAILVNGQEKKFIQKINNKIIEEMYNGKKEIGLWIDEIMSKNDRKNHKTLTTGCLCLSRGVTMQSENGYITHIVIGPGIDRKNDAEKYQTCARVCGNLRNFKNYGKYGVPTIICSEKFLDHVRIMEDYIYAIADCKGFEVDEKTSNKKFMESKNKIKNKDIDVLEFKDVDDLKDECKYREFQVQWNRFKPNDDGFCLANLRGETRVFSCDEIKSNLKWGITGKTTKTHRIYPCYIDVTNKRTLIWILVCKKELCEY